MNLGLLAMPYTRLRYHIVTATSRRRPLLVGVVEALVYATCRKVALEQGANVIAIGGVEDHVHVILACPPSQRLSAVIGAMKSRASRAINDAELLEIPFAWQVGYSAFTLRAWDYHRAVIYVESQKERHASRTLIPRLEPVPPF